MRRILAAVAALVAFSACAGESAPPDPVAAGAQADHARSGRARATERLERAAAPKRVDPRRGGLEVVLGEWAVTPEAPAIRPGRVTFVVHNRGTMGHGFEMELEGESSGHGSGDLFKAESELVGPGESTRMTVTLPPGLYEIECLADGHDDMGMEGVLEVREGAPLVAVGEPREDGRIAIRDFAFDPPVVTVAAGTEISWRNDDPTDHTVTALDPGSGLRSDVLSSGDVFRYRAKERGVFEYQCAIHPEMKGKVKVE